MSRANILRLVLLAALLATLVRAVIAHSGEWAVVAVVGVVLLATLLANLRHAA